jgi:signal transduction histidine kinase
MAKGYCALARAARSASRNATAFPAILCLVCLRTGRATSGPEPKADWISFEISQSQPFRRVKKGLNRVDGDRIVIYDQRTGLPSDVIGSLFEDGAGRLWVDSALTDGPNTGLALGSKGRFHQQDLPGSQKIRSIAAITEDLAGVLWFSDLERGLISVQGGDIKNILPWSRFDNRQALALEADPKRGGIFLGFAQGGVAYYQQGFPLKWYTVADGLGSGAVTDLHIDPDGTAWIATQGGLSRLRNDRIATLNTKNNLGCDPIHALVEDQDGAIWLNTPCGLQRLARKDLAAWTANPAIKIQPRIYGAREGMHSRSTTSGFFRGAVRSTDGRIWFPVFDGVAVVDPKNLHENPLPPPVAIDAIRVDGRTYVPKPDLRFGPLAKDLQINYTAFSFVDADRVHFRYYLEGYDREWHDAMGRREAFYSTLPPRRYRFRVIASNSDGVWNEKGAFVDFVVEPAFYQRVWFLLVCATALGGALFVAHKLRLRQVEAKLHLLFEERVRERTRIGSELHDTLLQTISGFALQLDVLSKTVKEPQSAPERLRELRREAEQCLHEARESVWDIRSHSDEEQDFAEALRQIGERLTQGTAIQFRTTVSGRKLAVPSSVQLHLLRIVEEAIRNAVCHSDAQEIHLEVSYADQYLVRLRIVDNGCGFDPHAASRRSAHWGLVTMRERSQRLGAEFKISTETGRGTQIEITIPITPASG